MTNIIRLRDYIIETQFSDRLDIKRSCFVVLKMAIAKNWCFTLNNYTEDEYNEVKTWNCQYLVVGREVGDQGTKHLQGYVQLIKKMRLTGVRKLSVRAHWEVSKGTPEQASEYCKKDKDFFEKGTMVKQGTPRNLDEMLRDVIEKKCPEEMYDQYGLVYINYKRKLEETARDVMDNKRRKVTMIYDIR